MIVISLNPCRLVNELSRTKYNPKAYRALPIESCLSFIFIMKQTPENYLYYGRKVGGPINHILMLNGIFDFIEP